MRVLLAGANSYIGTCLIPVLLQKGHDVVCLVRDKDHFKRTSTYANAVTIIGGDLLRKQSIEPLPQDIDSACYLVNKLSQTSEFVALGALSAQNFMEIVSKTLCRQIITLGDIDNSATTDKASRLNTENILKNSGQAVTSLNAATIIGPGSTALEMFHTLTSKAQVVVPQNWMKTRLQPIAATDVVCYIEGCLLNEKTFNRKFDMGGPDILTFKQMLFIYIAMYKSFKPGIMILPFLTSQLSSHLLNSLAPVNYAEAKSLIENLKHDTLCGGADIKEIISLQPLTFKQALRLANEESGTKNRLDLSLFKLN